MNARPEDLPNKVFLKNLCCRYRSDTRFLLCAVNPKGHCSTCTEYEADPAVTQDELDALVRASLIGDEFFRFRLRYNSMLKTSGF